MNSLCASFSEDIFYVMFKKVTFKEESELSLLK